MANDDLTAREPESEPSSILARPNWQLGLCSVTFRDLSYPAILNLCMQAGIEAIEWSAESHAPPGVYRLASDIQQACAERNIRIASLGSYHCVNGRSAQAFEVLVETARKLGAPNIRVWAGERGKSSTDTSASERRNIVADFKAISQMARDANITVAIEYHRLTLADAALQVIDLINDVQADNLFSYWQRLPGVDLSRAIEEVGTLGDRLVNIHVFNWDEVGARHPLHEAEEFWRPLLHVAKSLKLRTATPSAMLEFVKGDDPVQFAADAALLRAMLASDSR